jgi:hypothetical protein
MAPVVKEYAGGAVEEEGRGREREWFCFRCIPPSHLCLAYAALINA